MAKLMTTKGRYTFLWTSTLCIIGMIHRLGYFSTNLSLGLISYKDPLCLGSKSLCMQTMANVLPGISTVWVM